MRVGTMLTAAHRARQEDGHHDNGNDHEHGGVGEIEIDAPDRDLDQRLQSELLDRRCHQASPFTAFRPDRLRQARSPGAGSRPHTPVRTSRGRRSSCPPPRRGRKRRSEAMARFRAGHREPPDARSDHHADDKLDSHPHGKADHGRGHPRPRPVRPFPSSVRRAAYAGAHPARSNKEVPSIFVSHDRRLRSFDPVSGSKRWTGSTPPPAPRMCTREKRLKHREAVYPCQGRRRPGNCGKILIFANFPNHPRTAGVPRQPCGPGQALSRTRIALRGSTETN